MKKYILLALLLTSVAPLAFAEQGDILVRLRGIAIVPDDDSDQVRVAGLGTVQGLNGGESSRVNVTKAIVPEVDITYMLTKYIGIEAIAGIANHDVELQDNGLSTLVTTLTGGAAGSCLTDGFKIFDTWVLPPTVTIQYHFMPDNNIRPYAGVGVNYTAFLWDDATTQLETAVGGPVHVNSRNGWAWAAQVGVDIDWKDNWYFNIDLKYIDLETEASIFIDGGPLAGTNLRVDTNVSPFVVGAGIGYRF
ncbi:MAG: OmpW family protein [Gammaproteobacteria bacterium]|jgi:outer membrane protein|nr:OmpW family protein [Gammaproteobacteria bacterium]